MGLLEWLGFRDVSAPSVDYTSRSLATPFAGESHLAKVTLDELFGSSVATVTRAEAMSVPAIAKARHLICETLGRQPLVAYRDGERLVDQPTWLYRTSTAVGPRLRTTWVLDDLLFTGWSLLAVERGAERQILDAQRVPLDRWRLNRDAEVEVRDRDGRYRVANVDEVVLIPGPFEGLLTAGARTIRAARQLEDQWIARVKNPVPVTEIRYTGEDDLEPEEMEDIRATYIRARQDDNGTVMVTPRGFEVVAHGDQALELHVQGRNAVVLDVARFTNIPAVLLDASNVNASSHSYTNQQLGRSDFLDLALRSWAFPLEERFSTDDCTPRGTYIAFDLSALRTADVGTGPALED